MHRQPVVFKNIAALMERVGLPSPLHPLVTLVNYDERKPDLIDAGSQYSLHFYKIAFKLRFSGKAKYGLGSYDFHDGGLAFVGPNQIVELSDDLEQHEGYALYFHPDLLYKHSLASRMNRYGFFSYSVSEALFLSEKEKNIIKSVFESIATELGTQTDQFSQDVLVSLIELLLHQCNRFYNRQFQTRKVIHHDLIDQMNLFLNKRFKKEEALVSGLPTPQEIADHLNISQRYLSDMLKSLTGHTTQQHIHLQMVDRAKEMLGSNTLTTQDVAYALGFEHPQSFNKLFKQKTGMSPAGFRKLLSSN